MCWLACNIGVELPEHNYLADSCGSSVSTLLEVIQKFQATEFLVNVPCSSEMLPTNAFRSAPTIPLPLIHSSILDIRVDSLDVAVYRTPKYIACRGLETWSRSKT